jgi:glycosyltransferase involved in cell wall biosynthesis
MTRVTAPSAPFGPVPLGIAPVVIATILRPAGATGVQTHIGQVLRYFGSSGVPACVVTPFSWAKRVSPFLFGVRLPLKLVSPEASVAWYRHWHHSFLKRGLEARLAECDDVVVYAQCPLSALAAIEARRGPQQRVVMAVHFQVSQADEWVKKHEIADSGRVFRSIRKLEAEVLGDVDGLIYLSRSAQENLASWLDLPASIPSAYIPNFIFPPTAGRRLAPVADLVTIGSLEGFRNHDFLLRVLAAARKRGRRYTLHVIGKGPRRRDLGRQAERLGVETQVRFLGYQPEAQRLLPQYRAYVHASLSESFSLAILEAMSAGLPVIAGRVGGIPELFDSDVEGRFWPLDDPERAAEILIELMEDRGALARAGAAGRDRVTRAFDARVVGPRLHRFLTGQPAAPRAAAAGE